MAKDLNKTERGEVEDIEYLLNGYRSQIRSARIYEDAAWCERTEQHHLKMIAEHRRQLDALRHMRANHEQIIVDCQAKIQVLLKQVKQKKHKADIERLVKLYTELNSAGVTDDTIEALRARFGKEIEDNDAA